MYYVTFIYKYHTVEQRFRTRVEAAIAVKNHSGDYSIKFI